ncbi:ATP-binding protein, partial [Pseudomonas aeruginosa]|nr:ATP-binding protein [Pseudomonas aeruginosa]
KDLARLDADVAAVMEEEQELAAEMSGLARGRDELRAQVKSLSARLSAADDTLLSFLRSRMPDWENTVGRVIDPRLLLREDLSPVIAAQSVGVFGLQIDLERLKPVAVPSLEA